LPHVIDAGGACRTDRYKILAWGTRPPESNKLAVEGFLLAGFVAAIGLYSALKSVPHAWIFLTLGLPAIGGLGILISVTTRRTIGWAYGHANVVADWWGKLKDAAGNRLSEQSRGYSFRNLTAEGRGCGQRRSPARPVAH